MVRPDHHGEHRRVYEKNKRIVFATQTHCGICGLEVDKTLKYGDPMAGCVDHIIPIAKGGHPSDLDNLQLAHWTCNRQKSDNLAIIATPMEHDNRILPQSMDWRSYKAN